MEYKKTEDLDLKRKTKNKKKLRLKIIEEANKTCYICGKKIKESKITIDHVTPKSKNGKNTKSNLKCCCKRCNIDKGDKYLLDYVISIMNNKDRYNYISEKKIKELYNLALNYERGGTYKENSLSS